MPILIPAVCSICACVSLPISAAVSEKDANAASTTNVPSSLSVAMPDTLHAHAGVSVGRMAGYTKYQIGGAVRYGDEVGRVRFPLSELKYPLNIFTFTVDAELALTNSYSFFGSYTRSINSFSGTTEDSDWGILYQDYPDEWDDPNSLDVFSETDTDLVMNQLNLGFWRRVHTRTNWWIDLGASYRYQGIDIELSNLDQWYPSPNDEYGYELPHDEQAGLVGTYQVTCHALFLSARVGAAHEDFGIAELSVGVAPSVPDVLSLVYATDTDEHVLRDPPVTGKGELYGYAFRAECKYEYPMNSNWSVRASCNLLYMELTGRQRNYEYGTWGWTTDQTVESLQASVNASLVWYPWSE